MTRGEFRQSVLGVMLIVGVIVWAATAITIQILLWRNDDPYVNMKTHGVLLIGIIGSVLLPLLAAGITGKILRKRVKE
jgi:hypothetical protein